MRINLLRYDNRDRRRQILRALIDELCEDYDLDSQRISTWAKTAKGSEQFVKYLEEKGYKVKIYKWPADEKDPLSWGLEFDEHNPNLVALKIRYLDDGDLG